MSKEAPSFLYWDGTSRDHMGKSHEALLPFPDRVLLEEALWGARILFPNQRQLKSSPLPGYQQRLRRKPVFLPPPGSNAVPQPFSYWSGVRGSQLR